MADFRTAESLGARILAARKARGFRTARDLANAIVGGNLTQATIENIESGRRVNLDVSQLLNIAKALSIPPTYLLAPLGRPDDAVDLPNLSEALKAMTAAEFDSWIANTPESGYQPVAMDERNASTQLIALREWIGLRRELSRLEVARALEQEVDPRGTPRTDSRLESTTIELTRVEAFLVSAGWEL
ncbi:hypothetical protein BH11ACT2_BH11ACT2_20400 [soil metagenome]